MLVWRRREPESPPIEVISRTLAIWKFILICGGAKLVYVHPVGNNNGYAVYVYDCGVSSPQKKTKNRLQQRESKRHGVLSTNEGVRRKPVSTKKKPHETGVNTPLNNK